MIDKLPVTHRFWRWGRDTIKWLTSCYTHVIHDVNSWPQTFHLADQTYKYTYVLYIWTYNWIFSQNDANINNLHIHFFLTSKVPLDFTPYWRIEKPAMLAWLSSLAPGLSFTKPNLKDVHISTVYIKTYSVIFLQETTRNMQLSHNHTCQFVINNSKQVDSKPDTCIIISSPP